MDIVIYGDVLFFLFGYDSAEHIGNVLELVALIALFQTFDLDQAAFPDYDFMLWDGHLSWFRKSVEIYFRQKFKESFQLL
jgi:hypothetical protein